MRPSRPVLTALLIVIALLLMTNTLWLFPDDGETEFTYERTEIEVEDGLLTDDSPDRYLSENNLNSIDCTFPSNSRLCAFDRSLLEHGPTTVSADSEFRTRGPTYTLVDGAYYERVAEHNETNGTSTLDLERVSPEELLAATANNVSHLNADDPHLDDIPLEYQIAVTGETVTTTTHLDGDSLGELFLRNGIYYTVVATGQEQIDRPLVSETRELLGLIGLVVLVVSLGRLIYRIDWTE